MTEKAESSPERDAGSRRSSPVLRGVTQIARLLALLQPDVVWTLTRDPKTNARRLVLGWPDDGSAEPLALGAPDLTAPDCVVIEGGRLEDRLADLDLIAPHVRADTLILMPDLGKRRSNLKLLLPLLARYRSDIAREYRPARPDGLALLSGITKAHDFAALNQASDKSSLPMVEPVPPEKVRAARTPQLLRWLPPLRPAANPLKLALRIPHTRDMRAYRSGDYPFAVGLGEALRALGHSVRIETSRDRSDPEAAPDLDIALRGFQPIPPRKGIRHLLWVIYPGMRKSPERDELVRADRAIFASESAAEEARSFDLPFTPGVLFQAFDKRVMFPPDPDAPRKGVLFVGSNQFDPPRLRPMVGLAVASGTAIELYGKNWPDLPAHIDHKANFIANRELGGLYRSAEVVLCDQMPRMRDLGYLANRMFDALACATPVISEPMGALPDGFADLVEMAETPDDFVAAVARIRAEGPAKKAQRHAFALRMRREHSFDARARAIALLAAQIVGPKS